MASIRLEIVDAIATALATATGLTAWRNLDFALDEDKLPALVVLSSDDRPEESPTQIRTLDQLADIEISILVAGSENPEADADPYEVSAHAALMAAAGFGGHPVTVQRLSGGWNFSLGDCVARNLAYRIGYRSAWADLET